MVCNSVHAYLSRQALLCQLCMVKDQLPNFDPKEYQTTFCLSRYPLIKLGTGPAVALCFPMRNTRACPTQQEAGYSCGCTAKQLGC